MREIFRESQIKHETQQRRLAEVQEQQTKFEETNRRQSFKLEKELKEQKMRAKLEFAENTIEIEKSNQIDQVILPKMRITSLDGAASDWIRFDTMFIRHMHNKTYQMKKHLSSGGSRPPYTPYVRQSKLRIYYCVKQISYTCFIQVTFLRY